MNWYRFSRTFNIRNADRMSDSISQNGAEEVHESYAKGLQGLTKKRRNDDPDAYMASDTAYTALFSSSTPSQFR